MNNVVLSIFSEGHNLCEMFEQVVLVLCDIVICCVTYILII